MNRYQAFLIIGVASVSTSAILIRFSAEHPLVISFYRMLLTSLILLPFALNELNKNRLPRKTILALVGVGAILALHFGLWITSLKLTTVASATILVCSHPLFVVPLSQKILGESLPRLAIAGAVVAFVGIVVMSYGDMSGGSIVGNAIALAAGVAAGVYIMAGREARKSREVVGEFGLEKSDSEEVEQEGGGVGIFSYAWIVYSSCALFTLMVMVPSGNFTISFPVEDWLLFLSMAIIPTILGHTMINASLKEVKAGIASTAILTEPLGAIVLAALAFSEFPPAISLFGGALVLLGVAMVVRRE